jgi:hypothetical protein
MGFNSAFKGLRGRVGSDINTYYSCLTTEESLFQKHGPRYENYCNSTKNESRQKGIYWRICEKM